MDEKTTKTQLNLFTLMEGDTPQESLIEINAKPEAKNAVPAENSVNTQEEADDWYDFDFEDMPAQKEDDSTESQQNTDLCDASLQNSLQNELLPNEKQQNESVNSPSMYQETLPIFENVNFKKANVNNEAIPLKDVSLLDIGFPIFEYADAKEVIRDMNISFESLRMEKSSDFPELENPERVSWTMDYGVIKAVDDKNKTIAQVKAELEASKEFISAIKKSKKPVVCKVKPRVIGQTKGTGSSYKGIFKDVESALNASKLISIIPSSDGHVYEIRNTEIGLFATRTKDVQELDNIFPCFKMYLPKIPSDILQQVITFFRSFLKKDTEFEALVHILWDRKEKAYTVYVPQQTVSKASVESMYNAFDENRYLLVADIHSHNTMPARFSAIDDEDEKATRIYIVIGKLNRYFPEINVRISNGGKYLKIDLCEVFELQRADYPIIWHADVCEALKDLIPINPINKDQISLQSESGAA